MVFADPTPGSSKPFVPYVIEPALGVDRLFLAVLTDAFQEEYLRGGKKRIVLRLDPRMAPYEMAVLPIVGNNPELVQRGHKLFEALLERGCRADFDATGSVGKRYRRHDEIGTPVCVTIDDHTVSDDTITLRCRDTMAQRRLPISELIENASTTWTKRKLIWS